MTHRPDCHELEDVVKTEVQGRPWCRKPTGDRDGGTSHREPSALSALGRPGLENAEQ